MQVCGCVYVPLDDTIVEIKCRFGQEILSVVWPGRLSAAGTLLTTVLVMVGNFRSMLLRSPVQRQAYPHSGC